ncbi:triosephosphate isomerase, cytosolic [Tanacetum coccineum]
MSSSPSQDQETQTLLIKTNQTHNNIQHEDQENDDNNLDNGLQRLDFYLLLMGFNQDSFLRFGLSWFMFLMIGVVVPVVVLMLTTNCLRCDLYQVKGKYGVMKFLFVDQYHGHVQSFSKDYVLKFDVSLIAQVVGVILCLNAAAKISHRAQGNAALASRWKAFSHHGVSSIAQVVGVILCLNAAAKITHRAQGIAALSSRWHALASRGPDDRSHMRFTYSNGNLEAASSLVRSVSSESDMEAMNHVPLPTNAQLTSQSFHTEILSLLNGTVDDVKKIVAILDAGDIPSTDVVGKYFLCYRIHHHNICPLDRFNSEARAPPFVFLTSVKSELRSEIQVAAQNCWVKKGGAFTSEVSAEMLANLGVPWVILGHSERRALLSETNEFVGDRVAYALSQGLKVIACVGENLEQRETGTTMEAVHAGLRNWFAEKVRSVIGSNCKVLAGQPDVDGFLVGGASLKCKVYVGSVSGALSDHNAGEDDNMDGIAMGKDSEIGVP